MKIHIHHCPCTTETQNEISNFLSALCIFMHNNLTPKKKMVMFYLVRFCSISESSICHCEINRTFTIIYQ